MANENMTKNELIESAYQHEGFDCDAGGFAEQCMSEQEAAEKYANATRARDNWQNKLMLVPWTLCVLVTLGLFGHIYFRVATAGLRPPVFEAFLAFGMCWVLGSASACCICLVMYVVYAIAGHEKKYKWLAPVAGSQLCERALDNLQNGGPNVQAWRVLALKERNQLLMFDFEIMESLRQAYDDANRRAVEDVLHNAACRALHGMPAQ